MGTLQATILENEPLVAALTKIERSSEKCLEEVQKVSLDQLQIQPFVYGILTQIHENDNETRTLLIPYLQSHSAEVFEKLEKIDSINGRIVKVILGANGGWLETSKFGQECNDMVWLLVQHMDRDVPYQKIILEKLKVSTETNKQDAKHYAYLYDRVDVSEQRPQLYGTQATFDKDSKKYVLNDVENPKCLNDRRKSLGLEPAEEYLEKLNYLYGKDMK